MAESQNFKELLLLLNDCLVEFLIVGGSSDLEHLGAERTKGLSRSL